MRVKKENLKLGQPAVKWTAGAVLAALMGAGLVSCGGGGGSGSSQPPGQTLSESAAQVTPAGDLNRFRLTSADVVELLERGVAAAASRNVQGTFAVVDRVGNVLAVYSTDRSTGLESCTEGQLSGGDIAITGGRGVTSGLDGKSPCFNRGLYAISKAITGAYLSSSGNAFSTRTASFIVQEHFPIAFDSSGQPLQNPAGPLFGVQFSQLPCGDLVLDADVSNGQRGPKRSPLGLSADPGGFPIYKNGVVVGGIGFISARGTYGLDLDPTNRDDDNEEFVVYSALNPSASNVTRLPNNDYRAPDSIRGDRISAGGPTFRYSDTDGSRFTLGSTSNLLAANYLSVTGYYNSTPLTESPATAIGVAYGVSASGYRPIQAGDLGAGPAGNTTFQEIETRLASKGAYVLVNGSGANRFSPSASSNLAGPGESAPTPATADDISAPDVALLLENAYNIAARGRAQIRTPLGSAIQVTISVVDKNGNTLGVVRTPDAPVFGTDVSLQKARSAVLMSKDVRSTLDAIQNTRNAGGRDFLPDLVRYRNITGFTTITQFDGQTAFSARGFGNFARPFWPDGRRDQPRGPFSRSINDWSPFSTGLQLDMALEKIATNLTAVGVTRSTSCMPDPSSLSVGNTNVPELPTRNGLQIFAGGFPLYRGNTLIGGIGISGDGIDQDDMIAFLGTRDAGQAGASVSHPSTSLRVSERSTLDGKSARYVNCPFKPFNDSDAEKVCEGL